MKHLSEELDNEALKEIIERQDWKKLVNQKSLPIGYCFCGSRTYPSTYDTLTGEYRCQLCKMFDVKERVNKFYE
jgi:hypothetical protein